MLSAPNAKALRQWACSDCGAVHDCDVNAARNLLVFAGAERRPRAMLGVEIPTLRARKRR
ncbi:MAG: transposase [Bradyrhizobium sp.]|nr:transposase [Bradyrhizobium sp.]